MTTIDKPKTGWRALPRNVWAVSATSFLTDISSEMVINLIPLFLANVLGEKTVIVGLIEGIAETTASLIKIFSGWLSDKLGQRKWLSVAGYGLSTLAKPFLYFATSWPLVLLVRFTDRVGKGIRTSPRDALVADSIDESQRGLAFGLHRAADTGGAFLGLLIAALVIWAAQAGQVNLARETFQTVVLLSIVPAALAVITLALAARDVPIPGLEPQAPRLSLKGFDRRFKIFLVIVVLFTLGNSSDAFLILRSQDLGISTLGIMGVLLVFNLVYTLVSGPAGSLSDRIGRRKLIVGGWLLYGLVYLGFALASAGWQILLAYAVYGVYYGMVEGTAKALVADVVTPAQRGTAYGVYNAAVGLTTFPACFIAGLLWQGFGPWGGFGASAPFLFGAALAILAAALMAFWLPRLRQEPAT
jgi:MFS family permease